MSSKLKASQWNTSKNLLPEISAPWVGGQDFVNLAELYTSRKPMWSKMDDNYLWISLLLSSIASHLLEAVGTFLLKWCRWPVWFPWQQGLSCAVSAGHTAHQCPNKDGPNTSIAVYRNDHMTCWNKWLYDSYLQCTMTCLAIWLAGTVAKQQWL